MDLIGLEKKALQEKLKLLKERNREKSEIENLKKQIEAEEEELKKDTIVSKLKNIKWGL